HLFALAYAFFQFVYFFFFFQAEDGIRDFHVTGVQTCALPISRYPLRASRSGAARMLLAQESADRFESLVVAVLGWASAASAAPGRTLGFGFGFVARNRRWQHAGIECRLIGLLGRAAGRTRAPARTRSLTARFTNERIVLGARFASFFAFDTRLPFGHVTALVVVTVATATRRLAPRLIVA